MKIFRTCFLFFLCSLFLGVGTIYPAQAAEEQINPALKFPSSAEAVAFSFYHLTQGKPDFQLWVRHSEEWQAAPQTDQPRLLEQKTKDLDQAYHNFILREPLLTVRTSVDIKTVTPGAPALNIDFPQKDIIYFPYRTGGQNFALIPSSIDLFRKINLQQNDLSLLVRRADSNGKATLVLELRPVAADAKKPMRLDGLDQWLILSEIGYLGLYNQYLEVLWSWSAPWYQEKTGQKPLSDILK